MNITLKSLASFILIFGFQNTTALARGGWEPEDVNLSPDPIKERSTYHKERSPLAYAGNPIGGQAQFTKHKPTFPSSNRGEAHEGFGASRRVVQTSGGTYTPRAKIGPSFFEGISTNKKKNFEKLAKKTKNVHIQTAFRAHQAAEFGFQKPQPTPEYSGQGVLENYQRSFYDTAAKQYDALGIPEEKRKVATSPVMDMANQNNLSYNQLTENEKEAHERYRQGFEVSVPSRTFDGSITKDFSQREMLALNENIVVSGDSQIIFDNYGPEVLGGDPLPGIGHLDTQVLIIPNDATNPGSNMSSQQVQKMALKYALNQASIYTMQKHAFAVKKSSIASPIVNATPADKILAQEVSKLADYFDMKHPELGRPFHFTDFSEVQDVLENKVIADNSYKTIAEINPKFAGEYQKSLELKKSYASRNSGMSRDDLANSIKNTSDRQASSTGSTSLSYQEATQVADLMINSPTLDYKDRVFEQFAAKINEAKEARKGKK